MSGVDILDRIDEVTAPVCGACAETIGPDGPSLYFCDDRCSDSWHRTQGEPLVGYVDPWHRPWDFPGIGSDVHVSGAGQTFVLDETLTAPPSREQPSVGSFEDGSRVYIDDGSGWREIIMVRFGDVQLASDLFPSIRVWFEEMTSAMVPALQQSAEAMRPMYEQMRRAGLVDEVSPGDPRERALAARRNRNTGPAPRGRAPRTIGRASTSARR